MCEVFLKDCEPESGKVFATFTKTANKKEEEQVEVGEERE